MKNRIGFSIGYILLGALLSLIPTVIFPVCESEKKMSCYYTAHAEFGIGIIVIILGIAYILFKSEELRAGISLSIAVNSILIVLLPLKLTGLCKMSGMACRIGTLPALIVIAIIIAAVSLGNFVYILISSKSKKNE